MTVIISGTDGVSDVDGDASTPALRGTDANTGIFFGADQVGVATNGVERVEFGNSETVFNDSGASVDFRVEGDTEANLLVVDASADAVGIGTATPAAALHINSTGAMIIPVGTTAQRPATPAKGMLRLNTDINDNVEVYNGTAFVTVGDQSGFPVDFLVIAGGGAGGTNNGGGGGAGGYRTSAGTSGGGASAESALTLATGTNFTVTVGAGGAATAGKGSNGSNSVFSTITSTGGGGGGSRTSGGTGGNVGGSGGGGSIDNADAAAAGTAGQGFAGGTTGGGGSGPAGGGGGAGEVGVNGGTGGAGSGEGGDGVASTITGSSIFRGGGGGGGNTGSGAQGGQGGGGSGGSPANNGTVNTGGGGGGTGSGSGGSGVVIIKYPDSRTISNPGGGLTLSTAGPSGGFKVTTVTAGTGNVSFA